MRHPTRRADTEALVDGEPLAADHPLTAVEDLFATMRTDFGAQPAPEPRPTLASILDGRRPLRPASDPVPRPTRQPVVGPRTRLLRPLAATFAAGAVMFGGLAAAGALPGPFQRATASIGEHVGLDLPGSDRVTPPPGASHTPAPSAPAHSRATSRGSTPSTAVAVTPSTVPTVPPTSVTPPVTIPNPHVGPLPVLLPALPLGPVVPAVPGSTRPSAPPLGLPALPIP